MEVLQSRVCRWGGVATILALLVGCRETMTIEVANAGPTMVDVRVGDVGRNVRLGQNGSGTFDASAPLQVGDALVRVEKRLVVVNTGEDTLRITRLNASGQEATLLLGECGTGYFSRTTPIRIGDVHVGVSKGQ